MHVIDHSISSLKLLGSTCVTISEESSRRTQHPTSVLTEWGGQLPSKIFTKGARRLQHRPKNCLCWGPHYCNHPLWLFWVLFVRVCNVRLALACSFSKTFFVRICGQTQSWTKATEAAHACVCWNYLKILMLDTTWLEGIRRSHVYSLNIFELQ